MGTGKVTDEMIDEELYIASDKYQITTLKAAIEQGLMNELSEETAVKLAIKTNACGSDAFKEETIKYLAENWSDISEWDDDLEKVKNHPDLMFKIINNMSNL